MRLAEAAEQIVDNSNSYYCFSRYTNQHRCNSNPTIAAINISLKTIIGDNAAAIIAGLRQSFKSVGILKEQKTELPLELLFSLLC